MDLSIWTNATVVEAVPPAAAAAAAGIPQRADGDDAGQWQVTVERRPATSSAETLTLRPTHLVFATGNSGQPRVPSLRGAEAFAGTQVTETLACISLHLPSNSLVSPHISLWVLAQIHSSEYDGGARFAGQRKCHDGLLSLLSLTLDPSCFPLSHARLLLLSPLQDAW